MYEQKAHAVNKKTTDDSIDDAKLIFCTEEACEMVPSFNIAKDNSFDCYNRFLAITFSIDSVHSDGSTLVKIPVLSYLSNIVSKDTELNVLSNKQITESSCLSINKYFLKHSLKMKNHFS